MSEQGRGARFEEMAALQHIQGVGEVGRARRPRQLDYILQYATIVLVYFNGGEGVQHFLDAIKVVVVPFFNVPTNKQHKHS